MIRRKTIELILLLTLVSLLSLDLGLLSSGAKSDIEPWALAPCIGSGSGVAETEPEWHSDQTGSLTLSSAFSARPYGDSCISSICYEIDDHDKVCAGASCEKSKSAVFHWAEFGGSESRVEFFFEVLKTHHGGEWTAWLVVHDRLSSGAHTSKTCKVYIERDFIYIDESEELFDTLRELCHQQASSEELKSGPKAKFYFKDSVKECFEPLFELSSAQDAPHREIVKYVSAGFIRDAKLRLLKRWKLGAKAQGLWNFENCEWPGTRASLFQELRSASAVGFYFDLAR